MRDAISASAVEALIAKVEIEAAFADGDDAGWSRTVDEAAYDEQQRLIAAQKSYNEQAGVSRQQ